MAEWIALTISVVVNICQAYVYFSSKKDSTAISDRKAKIETIDNLVKELNSLCLEATKYWTENNNNNFIVLRQSLAILETKHESAEPFLWNTMMVDWKRVWIAITSEDTYGVDLKRTFLHTDHYVVNISNTIISLEKKLLKYKENL